MNWDEIDSTDKEFVVDTEHDYPKDAFERILRAKCIVNSIPITFYIIKFRYNFKCYIRDQYYIYIYDNNGVFIMAGMRYEDQAIHAAKNVVKLVQAGRYVRSIKLYELSIGWSYGKTAPDFDPVVINGELVEGQQSVNTVYIY